MMSTAIITPDITCGKVSASFSGMPPISHLRSGQRSDNSLPSLAASLSALYPRIGSPMMDMVRTPLRRTMLPSCHEGVIFAN